MEAIEGEIENVVESPNVESPVMGEILEIYKFLGIRRKGAWCSRAHRLLLHATFFLSLLSNLVPQTLVVLYDNDKYDMFDKAEAVSIIFPMSRVLIMVWNKLHNIEEFWDFYSDLQAMHDYNARDPIKKKVLEENRKLASVLVKVFLYMYIIIFILFTTMPCALAVAQTLAGDPDAFQLHFKTEFIIVDTDKNPAFAIIYILQTISAFFSIYIGVITALFLSACINVNAQLVIVTSRFEKLAENSRNIKTAQRDYEIRKSASERDEYIEDEEERNIEELKSCIKHHIAIIALVKKFENVFNFQIGMECLMSGGITCLAMFQVTYSSALSAQIKYFCLATFFYIGVYVQISQCQKLIDESARLERAVRQTRWERRGARYGRLVALALLRAQKPLHITGLHLYIISTETFLKLLKTTFSYFTLLQTVAEK